MWKMTSRGREKQARLEGQESLQKYVHQHYSSLWNAKQPWSNSFFFFQRISHYILGIGDSFPCKVDITILCVNEMDYSCLVLKEIPSSSSIFHVIYHCFMWYFMFSKYHLHGMTFKFFRVGQKLPFWVRRNGLALGSVSGWSLGQIIWTFLKMLFPIHLLLYRGFRKTRWPKYSKVLLKIIKVHKW